MPSASPLSAMARSLSLGPVRRTGLAKPASSSSSTPARLALAGIASLLLLALWLTLAPAGSRGARGLGFRSSGAACSRRGARLGGMVQAGGSAGQEALIWRRPQAWLIGDSLTQQGTELQGWGVRLGHAYQRKLDVLNRGNSGYTSASTLLVLPEMLAQMAGEQVVFATLMLGTNDAANPASSFGKAHVPLQEFAANMRAIAQQLLGPGDVKALVLLTPPPIADEGVRKSAKTRGDLTHTHARAAPYAAAVRELAASLPGVLLLDVWRLFEATPGWQGELLKPDGIHLSAAGGQLLADSLLKLLDAKAPHVGPAALPFHHPTWRALDYRDAGAAQFAAERAAWSRCE